MKSSGHIITTRRLDPVQIIYICVCVCVCVCVESIDYDEPDKMIKISRKIDKSNTDKSLVVVIFHSC